MYAQSHTNWEEEGGGRWKFLALPANVLGPRQASWGWALYRPRQAFHNTGWCACVRVCVCERVCGTAHGSLSSLSEEGFEAHSEMHVLAFLA